MPEKDNIILIGLPGAGKSTLGIVLAKILNYAFVDADLLIQEQTDKTLQMIIDAMGPQGFIEVENEVLKQIERHRTIIATGGSAVYSDEAMQHLKSIGTVVQLKITYDELERRLGDLDERGVVLRNGKVVDLHALYDERTPLYEKYADYSIDVSDITVREAARNLADLLRSHGCLAD
jgi:shikimate kinase